MRWGGLCGALLMYGGLAWGGPSGELDPELREVLRSAIGQSQSFADRYEAEVWLAAMSNRIAPYISEPDERIEFLRMLHEEAERARIPPELALAVIEIESRFDRYAISYAGAQGYMQIMPFWLEEIAGPGDNLFNARTNLRMGCTILRFYLDKEKGDVAPALARYNGSYGRSEYSDKVLAALARRWYR